MILEMQALVAPLTAAVVGVLTAWHVKRKVSFYRERCYDLIETQKALVAHYDAMDRIILTPEVPEKLKKSLISVSRELGNRDVSRRVCEAVIGNGKSGNTSKAESVESSLDAVRNARPDIAKDIETAMSSALFILMLRWPETSKQFKRFVVSSMINDEKEAETFSRASEIVRKNTKSFADDVPAYVNAACAA